MDNSKEVSRLAQVRLPIARANVGKGHLCPAHANVNPTNIKKTWIIVQTAVQMIVVNRACLYITYIIAKKLVGDPKRK